MKRIDLRSDTVTTPTGEMRMAMMDAEVGDDVYGDDPTTLRLEKLAAERMGKEAALFVPSGTMGNELAIMVHTRPGDEIIASTRCHIVTHEAGGPARLSGVNYALSDNAGGEITPGDIHRLVRPGGDIHYARTSLLCLENALSSGRVVPLKAMEETAEAAHGRGLKVHLDGARIFNAALALGCNAAALAACADSVMFCVSKGLAAPVGSLLCGSEEFITEARRCRKLLGGGMRQTGVLAACGILSLEKMTERLKEDHDNAKLLGKLLSEIEGIRVDLQGIGINMVYWKPVVEGFDGAAFSKFMAAQGIVTGGYMDGMYRFVTHKDISTEDVAVAAKAVAVYMEAMRP